MVMKFLLSFLLWYPVVLMAQDDKFPIQFEEMEHDFGLIKEVDGKVSKRFYFQNTSNQDVKLKEVFVACGCTSPAWPQQVLSSQDTASILITFDPTDRPGAFDKYIRVEIEGVAEPMYLIIKGKVLPRPPGPRDWYPFRLGDLWFQNQNMFVGSLYQDEKKTVKNIVYNAGSEPITVLLTESKLPKFVSLEFEKVTISPQDSAYFFLNYNAKKRKDWGFVSNEFQLHTTDSIKTLRAGVILKERFKPNRKKTPNLVHDQDIYKFGDVIVGATPSITIVLKNEGNKKLIIRKLKLSSCNCLEAVLPQQSLKPGEQMELSVKIDTKNLFGWQNHGISLITNDPKNHLVDLRIEGNIVEPEK